MTRIKVAVFIALLIFADQLSKYIIRASGGFYICNQNLAFGLKLSYFVFFMLLILAVALMFSGFGNPKSKALNPKQIQKNNNLNLKRFRILNFSNWNLFSIWDLVFRIFKKYHLPLSLILSGGISNLINRFYFGCVIDFINLKVWPVFNLADVYITIGAIVLILKIKMQKSK